MFIPQTILDIQKTMERLAIFLSSLTSFLSESQVLSITEPLVPLSAPSRPAQVNHENGLPGMAYIQVDTDGIGWLHVDASFTLKN